MTDRLAAAPAPRPDAPPRPIGAYGHNGRTGGWSWAVWRSFDEWYDGAKPFVTGKAFNGAKAEAAMRAAAPKVVLPYGEYRHDIRRMTFWPRRRSRCFALLGLEPPCTVREVHGAFRRLVKGAHPDHGGDAAQFRVLCDAYKAALRRCRAT